MNAIYEHANEQHLRAVEVFAADVEGAISYDEAGTKPVPVAEAIDLFNKGVLVIVDNTNDYRCRPAMADVGTEGKVVFHCGYVSTTAIWYSAED